MSLQIFLEGKILGVDDCLLAPASNDPDQVFTGRSHWISLLSEVLPRACWPNWGWPRFCSVRAAGASSLAVLPEESRAPAEVFLNAAATEIAALSAGALKLVWSMTENLGDWSDVRRRLEERLDRGRHAPAAQAGAALFSTAVPEPDPATDDYFRGQLGFFAARHPERILVA
jgi:hypothetical protein